MYQPGQKWQDGCKYECICEDGITGRYKCSERYIAKMRRLWMGE